jgi:positive regulator of sigma E activity
VPKEMDVKSLKKGTQIQINIEASKLVQLALLLYLLPIISILFVALIADLAGFSEMLILALVVIVLSFSMRMIHRYLKSHVGLEEINLSLIPDGR